MSDLILSEQFFVHLLRFRLVAEYGSLDLAVDALTITTKLAPEWNVASPIAKVVMLVAVLLPHSTNSQITAAMVPVRKLAERMRKIASSFI